MNTAVAEGTIAALAVPEYINELKKKAEPETVW
jgi:hypothetical protein